MKPLHWKIETSRNAKLAFHKFVFKKTSRYSLTIFTNA